MLSVHLTELPHLIWNSQVKNLFLIIFQTSGPCILTCIRIPMELSKISYSQSPPCFSKILTQHLRQRILMLTSTRWFWCRWPTVHSLQNTSMESFINEPLGLVSVFLSQIYSTPLLKKTHHDFGTTAANHMLGLFCFPLFSKDHFISLQLTIKAG